MQKVTVICYFLLQPIQRKVQFFQDSSPTVNHSMLDRSFYQRKGIYRKKRSFSSSPEVDICESTPRLEQSFATYFGLK